MKDFWTAVEIHLTFCIVTLFEHVGCTEYSELEDLFLIVFIVQQHAFWNSTVDRKNNEYWHIFIDSIAYLLCITVFLKPWRGYSIVFLDKIMR